MSGGSRKELIAEIVTNKDFRHFWSESYLRKNIPFQLKTLRTERKMSQIEAAELLGKGQSAISRWESPAYGKLTLSTLLEAARFYDVGVVVKFVPFSQLLREYEDVSFDALRAASPSAEFPDELAALNEWANESDGGFWEEGDNVLRSDRFPKEVAQSNASGTFTLPMLTAVPSAQSAENVSAAESGEWTAVVGDSAVAALTTHKAA